MSFEKYLIGVKNYEAGCEFQFIFSDGSCSKFKTETPESEFEIKLIKPEDKVRSVILRYVKASKTASRRGCLEGIQFINEVGKVILTAGNYWDEPIYAYHKVLLGENERVVGVESNTSKDNYACHCDFQLRIGKLV